MRPTSHATRRTPASTPARPPARTPGREARAPLALDLMRPSEAFATAPARLADPARWMRAFQITLAAGAALGVLLAATAAAALR